MIVLDKAEEGWYLRLTLRCLHLVLGSLHWFGLNRLRTCTGTSTTRSLLYRDLVRLSGWCKTHFQVLNLLRAVMGLN